MFQQNADKWFFVCDTNSRNFIPLFHKQIISQGRLQKIYRNLARTCKNKFYENKIKLNWLNLFKKVLLRYPRSVSDNVKKSKTLDSVVNLRLMNIKYLAKKMCGNTVIINYAKEVSLKP